MAIQDFNHIKSILNALNLKRPARFGYTQAALDATGATEITALTGVYAPEDSSQINSIPEPEQVAMESLVMSIGLRTQAATASRMMMNHFFGRLSLNMIKLTEKIKLLVDDHLVNRYITPSGNIMEDVTIGYTADTIRMVKHKSPLSASAPITSSAAISLLAAVYNGNAGVMTGADKKSLTDTVTDLAGLHNTLAGDETVTGIKTFSSIPVLPASDPTTDNQAARKAYVDASAANVVPYVAASLSSLALKEMELLEIKSTFCDPLNIPSEYMIADGSVFPVGSAAKIIHNTGGTLLSGTPFAKTYAAKGLTNMPNVLGQHLRYTPLGVVDGDRGTRIQFLSGTIAANLLTATLAPFHINMIKHAIDRGYTVYIGQGIQINNGGTWTWNRLISGVDQGNSTVTLSGGAGTPTAGTFTLMLQGDIVGSFQLDQFQDHYVQIMTNAFDSAGGGSGTNAAAGGWGFTNWLNMTGQYFSEKAGGPPRVGVETRGKNIALLPLIRVYL